MPASPIVHSIAPFACACTCVVLAFSGPAQADPRLDCTIEQGGETQQIRTAPVADPYTVAPVDIRGRFRFKAVMIGDERHVDYIHLYTYFVSDGTPVLVHQASHHPPFAVSVDGSATLTGLQRVYSPVLGREMTYRCALTDAAP
ncbi:MAG: hypothetical protein IPK20_13500 [Betaproteobacteria bacterium]|nr:hypothetical protein [Betaproteobacteria bacterium]